MDANLNPVVDVHLLFVNELRLRIPTPRSLLVVVEPCFFSGIVKRTPCIVVIGFAVKIL